MVFGRQTFIVCPGRNSLEQIYPRYLPSLSLHRARAYFLNLEAGQSYQNTLNKGINLTECHAQPHAFGCKGV